MKCNIVNAEAQIQLESVEAQSELESVEAQIELEIIESQFELPNIDGKVNCKTFGRTPTQVRKCCAQSRPVKQKAANSKGRHRDPLFVFRIHMADWQG